MSKFSSIPSLLSDAVGAVHNLGTRAVNSRFAASIFASPRLADSQGVFSVGEVLFSVAIIALSAILGRYEGGFSCYPFGVALLAASSSRLGAVYSGLMLSTLFSRGSAIALAIVYTLELLLRYSVARLVGDVGFPGRLHKQLTGEIQSPTKLLSADLQSRTRRDVTAQAHSARAHAASVRSPVSYDEPILMRIAVSALTAFVFGLWRLIGGGFLYFDLFGLVTAFLLCPMLTLAMSTKLTSRERLAPYSGIGMLTLMLCFIISLSDVRLAGFSPSYIIALLTALTAAVCLPGDALSSGFRGCTIGLVAGLACMGGSGGTAAYLPLISAASGLVAGMLWKLSRALCAAGALMSSLTIALLSSGFGSLVTVLPDTLAAVTLFLPISLLTQSGGIPGILLPSRAVPTHSAECTATVGERKSADTRERMAALSAAFARLSEIIYTLSDRLRRPGIVDLKQICDESFYAHCADCPNMPLCLERECSSTLDAQSKLTGELYQVGNITPECAPVWLRERCERLDDIISEINCRTAELICELISSDKTEAFALDYEAISELLAEAIEASEEEYKIDAELTSKLNRSLKYMNLAGASAICWGKRRLNVVISGASPVAIKLGVDDLRVMIENTLHAILTKPKLSLDGERAELLMCSRRRFAVESAISTSVKASESANGDTALLFEGREDYFYGLISDGMGSGREAAITSKLCCVFVEQLLSGGNSKAVTLELLNGFLRQRRGECSATVDLVEIDLIDGTACFVKSGAAPSFVLRDGNLYKLESRTSPIGILDELDAEQIKFGLREGDVIVQLSDGVAQSLEDGAWLANLLTFDWCDCLEEMARKIIEGASENERSDDMTVVLMRVKGDDNEESIAS